VNHGYKHVEMNGVHKTAGYRPSHTDHGEIRNPLGVHISSLSQILLRGLLYIAMVSVPVYKMRMIVQLRIKNNIFTLLY